MLAIVSPGGGRVASACWNLARQGSGWSLDLVDWSKSAVHGMIEMNLQNGYLVDGLLGLLWCTVLVPCFP